MKVLVTGSRDYTNREHVDRVLDGLHARTPITLLITGACPYGGADSLATEWAWKNEVDFAGYPARFKTGAHGKAEGPLRNRRMVALCPDLVVSFPGGRGTADCIQAASDAKIPILRCEP